MNGSPFSSVQTSISVDSGLAGPRPGLQGSRLQKLMGMEACLSPNAYYVLFLCCVLLVWCLEQKRNEMVKRNRTGRHSQNIDSEFTSFSTVVTEPGQWC